MKKGSLSFDLFILVILIAVFHLISSYNYLLFHTLIELVSITVAIALFTIVWNSRKYITNDYLLFLGIAYFFIGSVDFFHTISYKGMNIFPGTDANPATQLWIIARYIESISLFCATFYINKKFRAERLIAVYLVIFTVSILTVVYGKFPVCYEEGTGLTLFKKVSEYIITIILLITLFRYHKIKHYLMKSVQWMIYLSIVFTIFSEISFTFYISVYGISNLIGHFFKLISFYLIYKALIVSSLQKPYENLFYKLQESEKRYRNAQKIGHVGNWEYNIQTLEFWGSDEAKRIYGFDPLASTFTTDEVESCIPERKAVHQALIDLIENNKPYDLVFEIHRKDNGESRFIHSIAILEKDDTGNNIKVSGVIHDITEKKKIDDKLALRDKNLQSILDNPVGYVIYRTRFNRETGLIEVINISPSFTKVLGIPKEDEKNFYKWFELIDQEDLPMIMEASEKGMNPPFKLNVEIRYNHPVSGLRWFSIRANGIPYEDDPEMIEYANGLIMDITELKLAQEQARNDLKEKNILIQEIYHRTKNNMAVISAMLSMHAEESDNDFINNIFREVNNKIHSMAMVHQKLYKAKNLTNIDLKDYVKDLLNLIMTSYGNLSENISLNLDLHEVSVSIDSAIPLGLIINELVSNIFKHAFPDNQKGNILIRLFKDEDQMTHLIFKDNGIGLPQGFEPKKDGSMGLVSVFAIVEKQLSGNLSYKSDNGLCWHIKIRDDSYSKRI